MWSVSGKSDKTTRAVRVDELIERGYLIFNTDLLRIFGGALGKPLKAFVVPRELLLSRS